MSSTLVGASYEEQVGNYKEQLNKLANAKREVDENHKNCESEVKKLEEKVSFRLLLKCFISCHICSWNLRLAITNTKVALYDVTLQ